MKRKLSARVGDFMAGQGFYIVLFLCVAAIGISGYFLLSSLGNGETAQVDQPTELVVTPTPQETQTAETQPPAESAAAPAGEPTGSSVAQRAGFHRSHAFSRGIPGRGTHRLYLAGQGKCGEGFQPGGAGL